MRIAAVLGCLGACDARLVIQGAGASFPALLYRDAALFYSALPTSEADVIYASMGSGNGKCRIMGWNETCSEDDRVEPLVIDYAGSDSLLKEDEYLAHPDLQMYPTVASAVVPVFNLPGVTASDPPLVLTTQTLADIFRSVITSWDDPQIAATNPALAASGKLPAATILLIVRADKSGTTELFKTALASFDPEGFGAQIGTSSSASWSGVTVDRCARPPTDTAPCLLATPYAMGYTNLAEVIAYSLPAVSILKPGVSVPVEPNIGSVYSALAELTTSLVGNAGPDSRLILDPTGGRSLAAWPILGVTYLVMRKSTSLFDGEDQCERRKQTVTYWHWFYTSPAVRALAAESGFSTLPGVMRDQVLRRLENDILCNGSPAYTRAGASRVIRGGGLDWLSISMRWNSITYTLAAPEYQAMLCTTAIAGLLAGTLEFVAVAKDDPLISATFDESLVVVPHMGVPIALAFTFCGLVRDGEECTLAGRTLVLTFELVASILDGTLSIWLDPRLVALNPWMADEPYTSAIGPTREIVLIGTEPSSSTSRIALQLIRKHVPSATFSALLPTGRAILVADVPSTVALLSATPFSVGLVPLAGAQSSFLSIAAIVSPFDPNLLLTPSRLSAAACASADVMPGETLLLAASVAADCYPLTATTVLLMRRSKNGTDCALTGATVEFAEWVTAAEATLPETLSEVVHIATMLSPLVRRRLHEVICNGESWLESRIEPNYLSGLLVGVVWGFSSLLLGVLLAWLVWAVFHWRTTLNSSQPVFQSIMLIGVVHSILAGLMATQDHRGRTPVESVPVGAPGRYPNLDVACVRQVWFYFIGNALIFGAMIAKLWRVTRLLVNPELRDIRVPLPVFLRYVGALVLVHVALLAAWTVMARPYYRFELYDREADGIQIWYGSCELLPPGALPFAVSLLVIELVLIQFGIYLCSRSRNVNPRYSEAKSIAFILWEFLQMVFIGLMVGALVYPFGDNGDPLTFFVVKWLAPMSVNITVTALMFVGKVVEWWTGRKKPLHIAVWSGSCNSPRHSANLHTHESNGSRDTAAEEVTNSKVKAECALGRVAHHADCKNPQEGSHRSSDRSHKTNTVVVGQEQNVVKSLISQLQEAHAAQRLAEEHLHDASADLTELRERNMELRDRSNILSHELRQARAAAAATD